MGITKKSFGKTSKNEAASLYILENKNGMKAVFTDYGANLVELWVPDKNGKLADVVLGYDNVKMYENNAPGYGSFIGRCANRTANASCEISGKKYPLEANDGTNNLHSGSKSYNKYMYEAETFEEDGELVVLDYKTDKVFKAEQLIEKYHAQLEYYAEALEKLTGKHVKEKFIYSFALRTEIEV